jgi:hypothetical protein
VPARQHNSSLAEATAGGGSLALDVERLAQHVLHFDEVCATTDDSGAIAVRPVLDVDDAPVTAAAFIGSRAHGVATSMKVKLFASVIDDGNAFSSALSADDIRELFS